MEKRIVIIGAGPTGLGAALRLHEKNYENWKIYEANNYVGGLSASFIDEAGFTWDQGGHVLFSSNEYFNNLITSFLAGNLTIRQRESSICMMNRWIPYPFQNNIKFLPAEEVLECLRGLYKVRNLEKAASNFKEWIFFTFGKGIARLFMVPYNYKVWATPLELMSKSWIAERVSVVDFQQIMENVLLERDDKGWGPNSTFRYPKRGGTGAIFESMKNVVVDHLEMNHELICIDTCRRKLIFSGNREEEYDALISTIPLDKLVEILEPRSPDLCSSARMLKHNGVYAVGIGLEKPTKGTRCWTYFPEDHYPFYRVTNLSFYSPWNVPQGRSSEFASLLCEVSSSECAGISEKDLTQKTIEGLIGSGLIDNNDRRKIASVWIRKLPYAYPIPTLKRDEALMKIQSRLENMNIYSRGRFGAWLYEKGNMDHSVMMGIETADRILEAQHEQSGHSLMIEN